jgi:acyl dehydratase
MSAAAQGSEDAAQSASPSASPSAGQGAAIAAIAELERTITLVDMIAYAGATWDWHRLHYDPAYIAERNLPGPAVDGQVFGAYLCEQLLDHFGPSSWVRRISFQFTSMVFAGERILVRAQIIADRGSEVDVSQEIHVGERLCVRGTATVETRRFGSETR